MDKKRPRIAPGPGSFEGLHPSFIDLTSWIMTPVRVAIWRRRALAQANRSARPKRRRLSRTARSIGVSASLAAVSIPLPPTSAAIAASKRKGLWVGGPLPLGYQMKDGKITVVEDEAERVRLIYRRYLELSGVNALVRDLKDKDIRTKIRVRASGATHGGIPFERGSLFYLLRNRFYIGEVKYKEEILPGEQPAIMDREPFDAVQQRLTDQWSHRNHAKTKSDHLLTGLLFGDPGHRMIPTHATKAGIRYRYYASLPHLKGESK